MPAVASNIPTAQTALNNYSSLNQLSLPSIKSGGISPNSNLGAGISFKPNGSVNAPDPVTGYKSNYSPTPAQGPAAPVLPKATTPVKKTITQNTDGSSQTTEYHAPLPPAPTAPLAQKTVSPFQVDPSTLGTPGNQQANVQANGQSAQPEGGVNTQNTTFPGIVSGLASTAAQGSPAAQGYASQTATYGAGNIPIGQQAQQIADKYGTQIANVGSQGAKFEGGQLTTGTSPVAEGNAAITAQTTAAQQQALATGENADLQGIGYQLTGQNQAAGATNEAAGQANQGQANIQSGLNQAGTLAQPNLGQPGQAYYNPQTGQAVQSSTGAPAGISPDVWSQYQNDFATGNFGAIPSSITNNAQLYGQLQQSAPAGFNYNTALGNAAAQQSNAQTQGVTGTNIAAQGLTGATQDYQNMVQANTAADSNAQNVQQILAATGLNSSSSNDYTKAINSLSGRLGSAQVTSLNTAITELQNTYSQLLNSGGTTPTGSEAQALAVLNPNSSAAQINAAITQLQTAATNKLSAASQKAQNYQSSLGGSSSNSGGSSGNAGGSIQTSYGTINPNL